jgi:hypothetical protein
LSLIYRLLNLTEGKNRSSLVHTMILVNILGLTVFLEGAKNSTTKQSLHELLVKEHKGNKPISSDKEGISQNIDKSDDNYLNLSNNLHKKTTNDKETFESTVEKQDNTILVESSMHMGKTEPSRRIRDNVINISEIAAERKSTDTNKILKKLVWHFPK